MSALMHSTLGRQLSVPAWLLAIAIAIAFALAIGATALLDGSNHQLAPPAHADAARQSTLAAPAQRDGVCLDSRVVGHC